METETVIPDNVSGPDVLAKIQALLARKDEIGNGFEFILSLQNFYSKKGYLTGKQFVALQTFEEKYDSSVIAEKNSKYEEWKKSFDDNKRNILKLCADYYSQTSYFSDLARKALADPNFIPTENQYRAMCENKYAKRLVENMTTQKYAPGQVVQTRVFNRSTPRVGSVVSTSSKITRYSANIGSRVYTVLWMDNGEEADISEKQIKLFRMKD